MTSLCPVWLAWGPQLHECNLTPLDPSMSRVSHPGNSAHPLMTCDSGL